MYQVELKGKLPSEVASMEDILTSNVFSFFRYSNRRVYLRSLISRIEGIAVTDAELDNADFIFWPVYPDGTEPDLVILVGNYYLLFEAKYLSGFGEESGERKSQLLRELCCGLEEARSLGRELTMVAITADSCCPKDIAIIPRHFQNQIRWMNWQTIAEILLKEIESSSGEKTSEALFAKDLYDLLAKKRLRGFLSFERLAGKYRSTLPKTIFFSASNASFRGDFIGFIEALGSSQSITKNNESLFFHRGQLQSGFLLVQG